MPLNQFYGTSGRNTPATSMRDRLAGGSSGLIDAAKYKAQMGLSLAEIEQLKARLALDRDALAEQTRQWNLAHGLDVAGAAQAADAAEAAESQANTSNIISGVGAAAGLADAVIPGGLSGVVGGVGEYLGLTGAPTTVAPTATSMGVDAGGSLLAPTSIPAATTGAAGLGGITSVGSGMGVTGASGSLIATGAPTLGALSSYVAPTAVELGALGANAAGLTGLADLGVSTTAASGATLVAPTATAAGAEAGAAGAAGTAGGALSTLSSAVPPLAVLTAMWLGRDYITDRIDDWTGSHRTTLDYTPQDQINQWNTNALSEWQSFTGDDALRDAVLAAAQNPEYDWQSSPYFHGAANAPGNLGNAPVLYSPSQYYGSQNAQALGRRYVSDNMAGIPTDRLYTPEEVARARMVQQTAVQQSAAGNRPLTTNMFAKGGTINEPVVGQGLETGQRYVFGEAGPEKVTPVRQRLEAGSGTPGLDWLKNLNFSV